MASTSAIQTITADPVGAGRRAVVRRAEELVVQAASSLGKDHDLTLEAAVLCNKIKDRILRSTESTSAPGGDQGALGAPSDESSRTSYQNGGRP